MNTFAMIVVNLVVFVAILGLLYFMQKRHLSFNIRVLIALSLGIICGTVLQLLYGAASAVTMQTNVWVAIVGTGYGEPVEDDRDPASVRSDYGRNNEH